MSQEYDPTAPFAILPEMTEEEPQKFAGIPFVECYSQLIPVPDSMEHALVHGGIDKIKAHMRTTKREYWGKGPDAPDEELSSDDDGEAYDIYKSEPDRSTQLQLAYFFNPRVDMAVELIGNNPDALKVFTGRVVRTLNRMWEAQQDKKMTERYVKKMQSTKLKTEKRPTGFSTYRAHVEMSLNHLAV